MSGLLRRLVAYALVTLAILGPAYLGMGYIVYDHLARVPAECSAPADSTPASFVIEGLDTAAYRVPRYEEVSLPSRDAGIDIRAWYLPTEAAPADSPAVVAVHGLGSCRHAPTLLLAAGMLRRARVATLLIDLREHGDSAREDGRHGGGVDEQRDVLGAWDWVVARGHRPERIGLLGMSLGAATVLLAAGEEPRVTAVWSDSSFGSIERAIDDEVARSRYPHLLVPAGLLAARLFGGDDLTSLSPTRAIARMADRAVYLTHGAADRRLCTCYVAELAAALRAAGGSVEPWIVPDSGHVEAIVRQPAEYERRLVGFFAAALAP
ncbi:MAG TPA: alpha/beta fold hydrolase [Candidatus Limnocylindrales bacterium]|nr:alpha/beta fold hydrolase [Candidatus Limnocylindrales bacterium]